jgi:excisionase family DNA binding protein
LNTVFRTTGKFSKPCGIDSPNKGETMRDTVTQDKRLTAKQVAEMLGLNRDTIYKWARCGRIPCIKLRHRLRFRLSDIERWEKQQTVGKF